VVEAKKSSIKTDIMRCSNCEHGGEIVTYPMGMDIEDDGSKTRWYLIEPIIIGQRRTCYFFPAWLISGPNTFIKPGDDDTCIRPNKFKLRSENSEV
jgi:hypothetical protein